ncbi:translation initiation factor eIF-2B subunit alpha isoform X1 [Chiroxiphia lanceolata]|uniref:translation initiation factor eIF-2B subunit alpha isoform X1 n=1 Tax=Chiroxiphia lanceolata TaxID=296741 RepID=UPI0013CE5428|nr:translation initiation factor eIF-2B subunit alpha isoform X1 [Chiroxiphia lanceolata]
MSPRPWPPSAPCWASSSRTEVGPGPLPAAPRVSPGPAPDPACPQGRPSRACGTACGTPSTRCPGWTPRWPCPPAGSCSCASSASRPWSTRYGPPCSAPLCRGTLPPHRHPPVFQDYSKCKEIMIERGEIFLRKVSLSRNKIAKLCHPFIRDGARILTHAYSRVVLRVLEAAVEAKKRFSVYVTESQPDQAGQKMAKALRKLNIPVTVILDAAVGYIMEKVDLVLVGAEGVVESGGIINKIGTNQIAVCAKAQNKPFYVVAESFKFVRLFPLNQQDVPDRFKYKADTLKTGQNLTEEHPWIDYTSPSLITLLFTDLGVLTPSAVSDELIKLYL